MGDVMDSGRHEVAQRTVRELDFSEGKLGGHLWDGGTWMAAWIASRGDGASLAAGGADLFEGRRVLELGSGVGLVGVTLAGVAGSVVLTDFGSGVDGLLHNGERLIPRGLLRNLRENIVLNGLDNAEVRHLDWHDFLGDAKAVVEEGFEILVAADVVYYRSDLLALAAAIAAHLLPRGRGFIMVPTRDWSGPLACERATVEDLLEVLEPFGRTTSTALLAYCGTLDAKPVTLVEFVRSSV